MSASNVKDMGLAEFGRKELILAEHEMRGLMATCEELSFAKPFARFNISGSFLFAPWRPPWVLQSWAAKR